MNLFSYAPMSARIVEHALSKEGFKGKDDVFKQLPGPTFEIDQVNFIILFVHQPLPQGIQYTKPDGTEKTPVVLVFYVGGVTHSEISAMRFISKNESIYIDQINAFLDSNTKADIIVASTSIINGKSLCESLCEYFSRVPFAPVNVPKPVPVAQAIKPTFVERDRQSTNFVIGGRGTQKQQFELNPQNRNERSQQAQQTSQQQARRVWGVR